MKDKDAEDITLTEGTHALRIVLTEEEVAKASVNVTVLDSVTGQAHVGAVVRIAGLEKYTDAYGQCQFLSLDPGSYIGRCEKDGYKVASVILDGVAITFDVDTGTF